jgi:hypothetical protein
MKNNKIPMTIKMTFSIFMAVLIPFYWQAYGPSNFLYFCDIALFLTLMGLWTENKTLISMAAVGILLPQIVWVVDYIGLFFNISLLGMTKYMFSDTISLFARSLSLFHGWLPFLLIYLVMKLGYCKKAMLNWTLLAWSAMLVSYWFMPAPGDLVASNTPVNINYVYGFSDTVKQEWLPDTIYLTILMLALPLFVYWPTAKVLSRLNKEKRIQTSLISKFD